MGFKGFGFRVLWTLKPQNPKPPKPMSDMIDKLNEMTKSIVRLI